MNEYIPLSQHDKELLEEYQRAYLETIIDELSHIAIRNRIKISFQDLYKRSCMNKNQIYRLLRIYPDFHTYVKSVVINVNIRVEALLRSAE